MSNMAPILVISVLVSMTQGIFSKDIQVTVQQGVLAGEQLQTVLGVSYYSFKGIPYAKPPVGALRFKAPQDPVSWEGVRNATSHGSVCPQMQILTNTFVNGSEDCLYGNVYTTTLSTTAYKPVLVSIHGGAFKFGSGDADTYGPDYFVEDLVTVTFNYRLDVLGFLSTGTCDAPGNAALKDQVALLKWVKNNIQNFGGDPKNVTLLGGTAGGLSVAYHMLSPMSKGLFHNAIVMSGSPLCDFGVSFQAARRAFKLGQTLGYETMNATALVEFLQSVSYDKFLNTTSVSASTVFASEEITEIPFKMLPFTGPVIEPVCPEGNFMTEDPYAVLASGNVSKVNAMISYNSHESLLLIQVYASTLIAQYNKYRELFVPSKILNNCTASQIINASDKIIGHYFGEKNINVENIADFINYASNASIVYDVQRFLRKWSSIANTYFFKFSSYSSRNQYGSLGASYNITGAAHFDDVSYLFEPQSRNLTLTVNSTEYKMIKQITSPLITFAQTGNPTPNSWMNCTWPAYNTSTQAYVNFADDVEVGYKADNDEYSFYSSLFDAVDMPL